MNWTGGSLQRTKTANRGIIQKQKAHFARARAHLQRSPSTRTTPFLPEYLIHSDGREVEHYALSSETGSVHHIGQSYRVRREASQRHVSPSASRCRPDKLDLHEYSPHFTPGRRNYEVEKEEQQAKRKKDADTDSETQLLEINKQRLLKQQDWIGIAASRPVELHFLSVKEKSRLGKRRKIDGKSKAVTRCRNPLSIPFLTGENKLEDPGDVFMSGALPILTAADHIRVRIGSDTLMDAASMQPSSYAQSRSNSDSMLFDEEGEDAPRQAQPEAQNTVSGYALASKPGLTGIQAARFSRSCSPPSCPSANYGIMQKPNDHAHGRIRHMSVEANAFDRSVQRSEATDLSYQLTHHVEGIERPVKLVFGNRCPWKDDHVMWPSDRIGKLQRSHADSDAEETKLGPGSQNAGDAYQAVARSHLKQPRIVDEEPWRTYLESSPSSSGQVHQHAGTGIDVQQPHIPKRDTVADRTRWPQQMTQGHLTQANLSTLPTASSARRQRSERPSDARPFLRNAAIHGHNNHEKIWRSFVLGSDPQSVVDTIHTHNEASEDSMSGATKGYASTTLPLSNVGTSVSSTPFPARPIRSVSRQASCISDDVQYTPPSGSRSIVPAAPCYAVWGSIDSPTEDIHGEGQGEETPAGHRFTEQSITSMQNHASHDGELLSDTKTSRSDLGRRGCTRDHVSRRMQTSGSNVWQPDQPSSIRDISDSDEAGIDLVDVDRSM